MISTHTHYEVNSILLENGRLIILLGMKFSVLGVTGQVGGATARALLDRGHAVRAVTRTAAAAASWQALGADVALADFGNRQALATAFADVDGVFVMTPPYTEAPDLFAAHNVAIENLCAAVTAANVPYLVLLSSIGAQHPSGLGAIKKNRDLEQAFNALSVPTVALRAGWFMENYRGQLRGARESGILPSMLDPLDLTVPMVATEDIGQIAADVLQREPNGNYVVEVAHAPAYSTNDVARSLTSIIGRPVTAVVIPRDERAGVYRSWGLSDGSAQAMSTMIDGFNSGWIAFEGGAVERAQAPTPLEISLQTLAEAELATTTKATF
jgi:NAD(P)H dehydrogenase (quinone)